MLEIKKAVRHAVPMVIIIAGVSGSGKTFSALLLAFGLVGPKGKVGFIDTENGRGSMYADSPGIVEAGPQGYDVIELTGPFHPTNYIAAIDAFERAGCNALVIDSGSHEWSGMGGCTDVAEHDKGRWNNAKLANKRYVNRLLSSSMHIIVCLRAQEKTKIIPKSESKSGKEEIIALGVLPICEKNLPYEATLSFMVEESTHLATPIKCPQPLIHLFPRPVLLSKSDGEKIAQWNQTGSVGDPHDRLKKRARASAEQGTIAYAAFFKSVTAAERKALAASTHAENKAISEQADRDFSVPTFGTKESPAEWPTDFDGPELYWNGDHFLLNPETGSYLKRVAS